MGFNSAFKGLKKKPWRCVGGRRYNCTHS